MKSSLPDALGAGARDPIGLYWVRRACRHPACAPSSLQAPLDRLGLGLPAPRVAAPLLLAENGDRGSLWTLASDDDDRRVEMLSAARGAWRLSGRVAARSLPILADPAAVDDARVPLLTPLHAEGGTDPVDGDSFGLSFVLAHLSRATGLPIASDLAASARLRADGTLDPVGGLDRKLDVVSRWAPGIRRLLVAASQVEEARGLAPHLEVVAVTTVTDAWSCAFADEDFDAVVARRWRDHPALVEAASRAFLALVLRPPGRTLRWAAVARAAALADGCPDPATAWRMAVVRAVADRHAGLPRPLPPSPPGLRLPRTRRDALAAHEIQALVDEARVSVPEALARARVFTDAADCPEPEELERLGATARLHAAWGQHPEAVALLRQVLDGWRELHEIHRASHAACELTRVAGILGGADLLREAEGHVRACLSEPETSEVSRSFLLFALGRACAMAGDEAGALRALAQEDHDWDAAPLHLQASRLRWLVLLGHAPDAHLARLQDLARREPDEAAFAWVLARVDQGDLSAFDAFDAVNAAELARVRTWAGEDPRRWAEVFPY